MSIVATHSHLVKQWSDENVKRPDEVTAGSSYRASWKDDYGHAWEARVADRALKGAGCPYCTNQRTMPGFNDLSTTHPLLAEEYSVHNDILVTQITAGSLRAVLWDGKCGHTWTAKPAARLRGTGCPYCSNQKILVGFNDFATVYPDMLEEWDPSNEVSPKEVSSVSRTRVSWVCAYGHKWSATVKSRISSGGTGCPSCVNVRKSRIEKYLHTTMERLFSSSHHGYDTGLRWPSGQRVVVDTYTPSINTVVEWDGSKWHSTRQEKDEQKSRLLLDSGFKVLRLRERPISLLNIQHSSYSDISVTHRVVEPFFENQLLKGIESLFLDKEESGEQ